jgi:ankyrin repeat protein
MSRSHPLPPDADLRQLRNQAKDLCRACREGDPNAIRRIGLAHPRFVGLTEAKVAAEGIALSDAQLVIARELGFDSWPKLKKHVESLSRQNVCLHELVADGNLQAMQEAVAQDPSYVNQLDEAGLPPLYTAALYRNQQAIDFLLVHGAVVDIFSCAYLGRAADAKTLLNRNPNLARATTQNGMTALHYAAMAGNFDVADMLLRFDADVNALDSHGMTPLMHACHAGPWKSQPADDIIQLLLDNNARVDLFQAAAMGRTALIETLLDQDGSLIDASDDDGNTALFHAARNNRFAAVKLLVERGADVNRSDAVGIAALHRTSQECSDELIQYLIDHRADAHLCCYVACGDETGTRDALARNPDAAREIFYEFNAVGYAIHSWQLGTLRILLEHGSTLSKEDQQEIHRISDNNHELLEELMAVQNERTTS